MSIKSQGHSLILVKGHSDFKVKCLTFGLYIQVSNSGPQGPLVHNLELQNAGLLMLKGIYIKKIKGNFCAQKSKKISIVIKNVILSEKTLKQCVLAIMFSNSFTYNQAEQIKKEIMCVQILLELHLTKHGRFHFQGRTTFYTPVLVRPSRHMTSK